MDVTAVLAAQGGVARLADLLACGVSRRAVDAALALGLVQRIARGVYCLAGSEDTSLARAVALGGVLSCASAAVHHGLEVFGPHALHVVAPGGLTPRRGVVGHRRPVEADQHATSLRQTLFDCARCLPVGQAVSVLDSALRSGQVDAAQLMGLVPARGRDAARVRTAVRLSDPQAQSVLESAARVLLVCERLGDVCSQVFVDRVGWVDLVVDGWLVIELDGYAYHRDRFEEDRRRDAELVRQGFVVLRFTYRDLLRRPQWVVRTVREALGRHRQARER